jgi:hypothetical protein
MPDSNVQYSCNYCSYILQLFGAMRKRSIEENTQLREVARDYGRVKNFMGAERTENILERVQERERVAKQTARKRNERVR